MKTKSGRFLLLIIMTVAASLLATAAPSQAQVRAQPDDAGESRSAASDDRSTTILDIATVTIAQASDKVVVPVSLTPGTQAIAAFQFEVRFDPAAMTPTGCNHLSGFGVCAPREGDRMVVNAARAQGWSEKQPVVEIMFAVRRSSPIVVTAVEGIWGVDSGELPESAYRFDSGAVQLGEVGEASASDSGPASWDRGGVITGTASHGVQDSGLYGAGVCAVAHQVRRARCAVTNSRGEYRIENLGAGAYTVEYFDRDDDAGSAAYELVGVMVRENETTQGVDFDLNLNHIDVANADDATTSTAWANSVSAITAGQASIPVAAADLRGDGMIGGVVTDAQGTPVVAVMVCADEMAIGTHMCAATGFSGRYEISGIPAGNYVVSMTDPGGRYNDWSSRRFGFDASTPRQIDIAASGL